MAFSPLHIFSAKLILCSAISIRSANSQPGPLPFHMLARKVDYREKMSYTLWRRSTGCQLYMCHSAPISDSFSTHTPSDSAEANPLLFSPFYLSLGLTSVFYSTATSKHIRMHWRHTHKTSHTERQMSESSPRYSDRSECSTIGAEDGELCWETETFMSSCRLLYK